MWAGGGASAIYRCAGGRGRCRVAAGPSHVCPARTTHENTRMHAVEAQTTTCACMHAAQVCRARVHAVVVVPSWPLQPSLFLPDPPPQTYRAGADSCLAYVPDLVQARDLHMPEGDDALAPSTGCALPAMGGSHQLDGGQRGDQDVCVRPPLTLKRKASNVPYTAPACTDMHAVQ